MSPALDVVLATTPSLVDLLLQPRYTLLELVAAVLLALMPGVQVVDVVMQVVSAKTGVDVEQPEPAQVEADSGEQTEGDAGE